MFRLFKRKDLTVKEKQAIPYEPVLTFNIRCITYTFTYTYP